MSSNFTTSQYHRILDLVRNGRITGELRGAACAVAVVVGPRGDLAGLRCVRAKTPDKALRDVFNAFGDILKTPEIGRRLQTRIPNLRAQLIRVAAIAVPVVILPKDLSRVLIETLTVEGPGPPAIGANVTDANLEQTAKMVVSTVLEHLHICGDVMREVDRPELLTDMLGTAFVMLTNWTKPASHLSSGCSLCGKRDAKLPGCSGCGYRWYCSKGCQRSDWRAGHRECCRRWGRMRRVVTARVAALTLG